MNSITITGAFGGFVVDVCAEGEHERHVCVDKDALFDVLDDLICDEDLYIDEDLF